MQADIEQALAPLVGLRLRDPGREGNRLTLAFGEGGAGAYALHVFCAWRLTRGRAILAGSADLFTPSDPDEELDTFDFEAPGATWWDASWRAYLDAADPAPAVAAVAADPFGGLRLTLGDGAALEVFPNSAPAAHVESEFWRLVQPGRSEPYFTVGTTGVERVAEA
jgi:hypothetical protein